MARGFESRVIKAEDEYLRMVRRMLGQKKAGTAVTRVTPEQLCEHLYGANTRHNPKAVTR